MADVIDPALRPALDVLKERRAALVARLEKYDAVIDVLENGDLEPAPFGLVADALKPPAPRRPASTRKPMSAKERASVSKRMRKYWRERRLAEGR